MLGFFLLICLSVYWLIQLKVHYLLKDDSIEEAELSREGRIYNVCYHAAVLNVISILVFMLGYTGCAWPYLFIEGIDRGSYLAGLFTFGLMPIALIGYAIYWGLRNTQGYIRISTDEIEYKRNMFFCVKIDDIEKITYSNSCLYQIHLKEKGKKPFNVNLSGFYKKKELCFELEQLRDYVTKASGRNNNILYKLRKLDQKFELYGQPLMHLFMGFVLLYTCYCCIDYDFCKKNYTAQFNALRADPNQAANAWPNYIQAAVNYTKLQESLQESINDSNSGQFKFSEAQKDDLRNWFNKNASAWASLKKAVSISYCNSTYKTISFPLNSADRNDFSNPADTGYRQIRDLYRNVNACRAAGVLDFGWFEIFKMQLASAKHFSEGKSCMDQLTGYGMLGRSIKLLEQQDRFEPEDLEKARTLLKKEFPCGLPQFNIEGEILIDCSTFEGMINIRPIPVQTPVNPMFLAIGSLTGIEEYTRKHYKTILEQAQQGVEVESKGLLISFPLLRHTLFHIVDGPIAKVYHVSERAGTNLRAGYVILDLEEYKLIKHDYPVSMSQLREAGLNSELPDDADSKGKITYLNDGQRAVLYAVGQNGKDDRGYNDEKRSKTKRDDIVFWQRNINQ